MRDLTFQNFSLYVGYAVCAIGGLALVGTALWLATDLTWKAIQMADFGARVIKKGLRAEAEDRRKARKEYPA